MATAWHPVTPHITDPDLAPIANIKQSTLATANVGGPNFFQEHKLAIIVAVIVCITIAVLIYMYVGKREKTTVSATQKKQPAAPDQNVNMSELQQLYEMRKHAKNKADVMQGQQQQVQQQMQVQLHQQQQQIQQQQRQLFQQQQLLQQANQILNQPAAEPAAEQTAEQPTVQPANESSADDLNMLINTLNDNVANAD